MAAGGRGCGGHRPHGGTVEAFGLFVGFTSGFMEAPDKDLFRVCTKSGIRGNP